MCSSSSSSLEEEKEEEVYLPHEDLLSPDRETLSSSFVFSYLRKDVDLIL